MTLPAEPHDADERGRNLVQRDPWETLRAHTPANIAIGRVGQSLPTRELLRFGLAHAQARDAVHIALDTERLRADLHADGWTTEMVASEAGSRDIYLRRPDLGRRLARESRARLERLAAGCPDLAIVIGDGLSSIALQHHAVPLLRALRERIADTRTIAPIVVATQARVALADDVGEALGARMAIILIGERPGLSSPDSLGVYATYGPRVGLTDAARNCISNVREAGLPYAVAAHKLAWLIGEAFRLQLTGTALKDLSGTVAIGSSY
jgi:ethanolamine ammonia-lyase small subunit